MFRGRSRNLSKLTNGAFFTINSGKQLTEDSLESLASLSSAQEPHTTGPLVSVFCCPLSTVFMLKKPALLIAPMLHSKAAAMHTEYAADDPRPALAGRLATTVTWRPDTSL